MSSSKPTSIENIPSCENTSVLNQCFSRPRGSGGTGKPEEVIRGSGDGSSPAGSRGRAPGEGLGGKAPETGDGADPQKLNRF